MFGTYRESIDIIKSLRAQVEAHCPLGSKFHKMAILSLAIADIERAEQADIQKMSNYCEEHGTDPATIADGPVDPRHLIKTP